VADLVADAVPEGASVLDACAAPGGKSLRLASRGLRVVAIDSSAERLKRLDENCARMGLKIEMSAWDWTLPPEPGSAMATTQFDAVLVDAPCSGLGTVRRHPDIRWRKTTPELFQAHLKTLATRQAALLHQLKRRVKPGGVLVYAVCSPEPEEGEAIARTLNWPIEARVDTSPGAVDAAAGADAHVAFRFRAPA
jgi:16S rRNA (cytosine967-C5)-methyltransferase